jgi:hypothetical protein
MKKLIQLLLVSCVLIWSTGVFADPPRNSSTQSPESNVTCGSGNGEQPVLFADISVSLNMEKCKPIDDTCAPCISSLEIQGCKFIDVILTHPVDVVIPSIASYLLSCDGR